MRSEKVNKKRWGKKFEDKRNWKEYNENLVRRGELYLSLDFLENWDNELERINKGKRENHSHTLSSSLSSCHLCT